MCFLFLKFSLIVSMKHLKMRSCLLSTCRGLQDSVEHLYICPLSLADNCSRGALTNKLRKWNQTCQTLYHIYKRYILDSSLLWKKYNSYAFLKKKLDIWNFNLLWWSLHNLVSKTCSIVTQGLPGDRINVKTKSSFKCWGKKKEMTT